MTSVPESTPRRLLIIDDNPTIHSDIKKILLPTTDDQDVQAAEAALFGTKACGGARTPFQVDSAFQGQEGLAMVEQAIAAGTPYAMAFVDVRMPPGWDGIETIRQIWNIYPELQIVICTAYSDHSWDEIIRSLGDSDSLVILKKPFDNVEVLQLAHALTKKWEVTRQARSRMADLDEIVRLRTAALSAANEQLQAEVRHRAGVEAALRASEERFQKAFQAAAVPMAILHAASQTYLEVNDSFVTLTTRSREQLVGNTPRSLQLLVDANEGDRIFEQLRAGQPVRERTCRIRRGVQDIRETLVSLEPVVLGEEFCVLAVMQDVTEQRLLEAQLRQAQKMEAVGQLAAGVAHDFNNLLTIIQGHTSLQAARAGLDLQQIHSLNQVRMAADRAASLTRQLLTFSRKQIVQRKPMHLNEVIERMSPMIVRMIGETLRLECDCGADLPPVFADENSVEQVVMNLVVNARDATPDGGTLRIFTEVVTLDAVAAKRNADARAGRFVCLSVADCGCGMDTSIMARLFEPFFTTKPKGKGTGLGLSTVYGIAKQHEGWVQVESQREVGSTFRVFLPITDKPVLAIDSTIAAMAPHGRQPAETILVVEDEAPLRDFICTTLARHGYKVLQAGDGLKAMFAWQTATAPIDLLLTDMVMPNGVSGAMLARRLSKKSERLKILYTSGYSTEVLENAGRLIDGENFLPKPFDVAKLIGTVQRCLAAQAEPQLNAVCAAA